MGSQELAKRAGYIGAADTAQALADVYAELARSAIGHSTKAVWQMAAEVAEDYALKARTKVHD